MNKETLQKFCDQGNTKMNAPFSYGGHTFATNGHIVVRVPRMPDVLEGGFLNEKAAEMFSTIPSDLSSMVSLPEFSEEDIEACRRCNGTGETAVCPECDGDGKITFSTRFNDYECECLSCHGYGEIRGKGQICGNCRGTGQEMSWKRIPLGNSGFSAGYLRLMRENLPNVQILANAPASACYFRFDGGDGFLMPMRG